MGLFRKKGTPAGADDVAPLGDWLPGRGLVLGLSMSGTIVQDGGAPPERVCTFQLEVRLDDVPRFQIEVVKQVPEYALSQVTPGESVVAVRVDPDDHARAVIDLGSEPPEIRLAPEPGQRTAAEIVAAGKPCDAVVVQSSRLGMRNPDDVELYAFLLTVIREGELPYQVRVGMPVPPEAVPLLFPGSRLPGRYLADGHPDDVVVDWDSALAAHL